METADVADLTLSHRAAACNALCAIIEACQASDVEYAQNAVLDDFIWLRLFEIFLQRSDNAKGKSMRQMLLVLTSVLSKNQSPPSLRLRDKASSVFVDIICQRQDRLKVKPALQGLAHFLQKGLLSIPQLIALHDKLLPARGTISRTALGSIQSLLSAFLAWIVHHDTSLSAGHLVKNFLGQLRRSSHYEAPGGDGLVSPLWIEPVVHTLHTWPDRIQEFKTHVFPHCFLPNIDEYLQFLSYLHISRHIGIRGHLSDEMQVYHHCKSVLGLLEEFKVLLATIQTGKELGILKDVGKRLVLRHGEYVTDHIIKIIDIVKPLKFMGAPFIYPMT